MTANAIALNEFSQLFNKGQLGTITIPTDFVDESGKATGGYSIFNGYMDEGCTQDENGIVLSKDASEKFFADLNTYKDKNNDSSRLDAREYKLWHFPNDDADVDEIITSFNEFSAIFNDLIINSQVGAESEAVPQEQTIKPAALTLPADAQADTVPATLTNGTNDDNQKLIDTLSETQRELEAAGQKIIDLQAENTRLTGEVSGYQGITDELAEVTYKYTDLSSDYAQLTTDNEALQLSYEEVVAKNVTFGDEIQTAQQEREKALLGQIDLQKMLLQKTTVLDRVSDKNNPEFEKVTAVIDGHTYNSPDGLTFESAEDAINFAYNWACKTDDGVKLIDTEEEYVEFLRQTCGYGTMSAQTFKGMDVYDDARDKDESRPIYTFDWLNGSDDYDSMNDGVLTTDELKNTYSWALIKSAFDKN